MVALIALVLTAAPAQKIAVLPLDALGIDPATATLIGESLTVEVSRVSGAQVVSQGELSSLLGLERQKQVLGCAEASCMSEIADALGVDQVVRGSLGKVGESTLLNLQLVDVKTAHVQGRISRRVANAEKVLDEIPGAIEELFGKKGGMDRPTAVATTTDAMNSSSATNTSSATPAEVTTTAGEMTRPKWPWAVVGAGAVAAAVGAGVIVTNTASANEFDRRSSCIDGDAASCKAGEDPNDQRYLDDTNALGASVQNRDAIGWTLVGVGGAAVVVGGVLAFALPSSPVKVAVLPAPGGAAASFAVALP